MKPLILLLLIPLLACTHDHEHPLIGHTHAHGHPLMSHTHDDYHEHDVPQHDHLNPLGLPFPFIDRIDPPMDVPGFPPFGTLQGPLDVINIYFVGYPTHMKLTKLDHPLYGSGEPHLDLYALDKYGARIVVSTNCGRAANTGWIGRADLPDFCINAPRRSNRTNGFSDARCPALTQGHRYTRPGGAARESRNLVGRP